MEFSITDKEFLGFIFSIVGSILAMIVWMYLDNRDQHRNIWKDIKIRSNRNIDQLLDIYKSVGGRPNGQKHWEKEHEDD